MTETSKTQLPDPAPEVGVEYRQVLADLLLVHPATIHEVSGFGGRDGERWFSIAGCFEYYQVASYKYMAARWAWKYEDETDEVGNTDRRALTKDKLVGYNNELDLGVWRERPEAISREDAAARAAIGGWDGLAETSYKDGNLRYVDACHVMRGRDCLKDFADFEREARRLREHGNPHVTPGLPEGMYRHGELSLLKRLDPSY